MASTSSLGALGVNWPVAADGAGNDVGPLDVEGEVLAVALHVDVDGGALGAGDHLDALVGGLVLGGLAVHLDDLVAGEDAGVERGGFLERGDDVEPAVAHVDLAADAGERAGHGLLELGGVLGGDVLGVGVVEGLEHAVDGALGELAGVGLLDVVGHDHALDVGDEVQAVRSAGHLRQSRGQLGDEEAEEEDEDQIQQEEASGTHGGSGEIGGEG